MTSLAWSSESKLRSNPLSGSEHVMHADVLPISPLGGTDRFGMALKGAVGVGVLLTAASGTLLSWLGHPGSTDLLLYAAATLGASLGAAVGYHTARQPR